MNNIRKYYYKKQKRSVIVKTSSKDFIEREIVTEKVLKSI